MQISTNLYYDRSNAQFSALSTKVNQIQNEISTGKKLNAPSDDAVGYQRLQGLNRGTADDKAWSSNITLAQTLLQQTDTALTSVTDRIQQVQELAVQANNGTLSADNRAALATQVRAALSDLVNIANSKDVRGQPLFGSATGDTAITQDASGNVTFTGSGDPPSIPIGDGNSVQPTESAQRVFGNIPTATGTTDVFSLLSSIASALDSGSPIPSGALDSLTAAGNQVSNVQGAAGARSARLDLEASRLQDTATARATETSSIQDVDVTSAITELQKTSTVLQATQASFSKFSQLSLFNYLR